MSKSTKIMAVFGVAAALGVAALPLASYADNTYSATTDITVSINETFSVTATAAVNTSVTNNAAIDATMKPKVTVTTNHATGWTLSAKTTHTGGPALKSGSNQIAAGTPAQGTSAWALSGGDLTGYTALSATDTLVKSASVATDTTGVETEFTIGVTASSSQASGTYEGTITWTGAIH